jgi:hypothetical protein
MTGSELVADASTQPRPWRRALRDATVLAFYNGMVALLTSLLIYAAATVLLAYHFSRTASFVLAVVFAFPTILVSGFYRQRALRAETEARRAEEFATKAQDIALDALKSLRETDESLQQAKVALQQAGDHQELLEAQRRTIAGLRKTIQGQVRLIEGLRKANVLPDTVDVFRRESD